MSRAAGVLTRPCEARRSRLGLELKEQPGPGPLSGAPRRLTTRVCFQQPS